MTKGGRIAGGVIALIGGGLIIIAAIIQYLAFMVSSNPAAITAMTASIALMALGIVGAILLLVDKTIGGVLALIAGVLIIAGQFIMVPGTPGPIQLTAPLAGFLDALLLAVGGIVGLAVGSEG